MRSSGIRRARSPPRTWRALPLPQAARVVAVRARAVRGLPAAAMAAVSLPARELTARLAGRDGPPLAVAAENAPRASVVAGDPGAVGALLEELAAEGVRARRIAVDYASPCAAVEPLGAGLAEALAGLAPGPASTPFLSTAGGGWLAGPELTSDHWYRNLRSPVRFGLAVEMLLEAGFRTFVELGPHPVLTYAVQETAAVLGNADSPCRSRGSARARRSPRTWGRWSTSMHPRSRATARAAGPCSCAGTRPGGGSPGPWPSGSRRRAVRRPVSY